MTSKKTAKPYTKSKKENMRLYLKQEKQVKRQIKAQLEDRYQTDKSTYYF